MKKNTNRNNATAATVKIMLSYNYCHFEVSKSIEGEITDQKINELRKDVQRLADEAVRQYQIAKRIENENVNLDYEKREYEALCKIIEKKPEHDRTIKEIAMLKAYQDKSYQKRYYIEYDYEDDELTHDWEMK